MKFPTYYSLASLIKAGKKKAKNKQVISFDLFDTLLIRRIHDPDIVKLPVARYISDLAAQQGISKGWQNIQQLRDAIEQRHRQETAKNFVDQEACYPHFMQELLEIIFQSKFNESLLQQVTDYELAMESTMLVPRQALVEWMKELAQTGKRIFVISDIYLPSSHLQRLLQQAGLNGFIEQVISSADTFLAKASGKAYPMIAEKFAISCQSWLHVGDNPVADGLRAAETGIDTLIIHDPREDQRKALVKRYYHYSEIKPLLRGRALQQLMAPLEGENRAVSELYVEGYNFLGPLIGIFLQQIRILCQEKKISKIFFLSREGWMFKQYWDKTVATLYPTGDLPETEYLYVSRMALAGASCAHQGLTKTNAYIALTPRGNRDFRDICRIFSLDAEKLLPHLVAHGLTTDTCLSPAHEGYRAEYRENFDALLLDQAFQDEVKRQTKGSNEAMQRYFTEAGLFAHENIAIVDIGWLGTIQRFLFEAIAHRPDCPNCFGMLFGAIRAIPYPEGRKNTIRGIMFDSQRFDLAGSTLYYAQDIFEEACRAPHPTLNGYRLTEEGYALEFRRADDASGLAEQEQDRYFAPLQQGILDSAEKFAAAAALLNFSFDDWKPWINFLFLSKLAFPHAREVANIRYRHHLDDFQGNKKPVAGAGKAFIPLWNQSPTQLKFNPLLRIRYFINHIRQRINE